MGHDAHEHHHHHHHEHSHEGYCCGCGHGHEKDKTKAALKYAFGAIPVIIGFLGFIPHHIPLWASIIAYALFGIEVFSGMLKGFARKRIFTEFTLMCVATLGAFAIGEYADAAAVMYLYSLGETVSDGAYAKSKRNISELLEIIPDRANVLRNGEISCVTPESVNIGEVILVRAGERVPLDGEVIFGGGYADTSSVTGEAKPLELYASVECPSGAMLTDGDVQIKVTKEYEKSVAVRLRRAVDEANEKKSRTEKRISRFAAVFTPIAFAVATCVFAVGTVLTGNVAQWAKAGIMILVVSCPCSLVLSVPLTYFAGVGSAATSGIIFRGGEVMDRTAKLGCVVFDKTGTLTDARLQFDGVVLYQDTEESEFLKIARAVLVHSPHAAAKSFCEQFSVADGVDVENVQIICGKGICCKIEGSTAIFGNEKLMSDNGIAVSHCDKTCIYGAFDGRLLGRLDFSSKVKDGAFDAVDGLYSDGVHRIAVVSGDNEGSVRDICQIIGIKEYYASRTPEQKLEAFSNIVDEERGKGFVAFCGDGLNDSAAIATADVGVAMGGCGSALTVESADVVLMDDAPQKIITAIRISRRTVHVANCNIILSLGIKVTVLFASVALASLGLDAPIELAIVADVGATIIAVLNSLRAAKREKI